MDAWYFNVFYYYYNIRFRNGKDPIWVYSDLNGYVIKTTKFRAHHVISKLGDSDNEDDIVVIKKIQVLKPCKSDGRFLLSDGNNAELLTTKTLTETLNVIQHNECIINNYLYRSCSITKIY